MLYYYNPEGRFQKESSREYKTEKGAVERLDKEGRGAVFDETGKMIISLVDKKEVPEGALDTNADGSVPAFNEDNEQVGTVDADTVAKATGESGEDSEEQEKQAEDLSGQEQPEGEPEEQKQLEGKMEELEQAGRVPFDVQTTCDSLRIRSGSGKDCRIVGYIREKTGNKMNHTIVEEKNGFGRLENGEGWIELAFTKKVS